MKPRNEMNAENNLEDKISGNGETVLVVDDEPQILMLAKIMLEDSGYRVLTAGTPGEAIVLAQKHAGKVQLLLADVVMPGMNGRDLAKRLQSSYPSLKVLFMSGHSAGIIGVMDENVNFISKPFSMATFAAKVREVLRGE